MWIHTQVEMNTEIYMQMESCSGREHCAKYTHRYYGISKKQLLFATF